MWDNYEDDPDYQKAQRSADRKSQMKVTGMIQQFVDQTDKAFLVNIKVRLPGYKILSMSTWLPKEPCTWNWNTNSVFIPQWLVDKLVRENPTKVELEL